MDPRVIACLVLWACLASAYKETNAVSGNVRATGGFYLRLYQALNRTGNLVFSTVSAENVLFLAYEASDGTTQDAMQKVLWPYPGVRQELTDKDKYVVGSSRGSAAVTYFVEPSKIYASDRFELNSSYIDEVGKKYDTKVESKINFTDTAKTAEAINTWIYNTTEDTLRDVVKPTDLDSNADLMILGVCDFYHQYRKVFDMGTTMETFYLNKKLTKQVEFMHMKNQTLDIVLDTKTLDALILVLYYFDKNYALTILLPNKIGNIEDMKDRLFKANTPPITDFIKKATTFTINLSVPKFYIESTVDLKEGLGKMGLDEIFSNNANFAGFAKDGSSIPKTFVSNIFQKTTLNMTQQRTVASGATAEKISNFTKKARSTDDAPKDFVKAEDINNPSKTARSTKDLPKDFVTAEEIISTSKTARSTNDPEPALQILVNHPFVFFITFLDRLDGPINLMTGQIYDPSNTP